MKRTIYAVITTCLGVILIGFNTKQINPPIKDIVEPVNTVIQPAVEPIALEVVPEPITVAETIVEPVQTSQGTCESEILKYDWSHSTANAVMLEESGGRTWVVNDNPSTEDYSVGCFQINLYGNNARNRPSEEELKNPAINVAYAYKLYTGNGNSFIGQWGVCRSKVNCY